MLTEGHPPPKLAPFEPRAEGHPLPKLAAFEPKGRLYSPCEVAPSTLSESKLALSGLAADPHPLPKFDRSERPTPRRRCGHISYGTNIESHNTV